MQVAFVTSSSCCAFYFTSIVSALGHGLDVPKQIPFPDHCFGFKLVHNFHRSTGCYSCRQTHISSLGNCTAPWFVQQRIWLKSKNHYHDETKEQRDEYLFSVSDPTGVSWVTIIIYTVNENMCGMLYTESLAKEVRRRMIRFKQKCKQGSWSHLSLLLEDDPHGLYSLAEVFQIRIYFKFCAAELVYFVVFFLFFFFLNV